MSEVGTKAIDAIGLLKEMKPGQIGERIKELERELAALRVLRRAANQLSGAAAESVKDRIHDFLQTSAPAKVSVIAKALDLNTGSLSPVLTENDIFYKTDGGWNCLGSGDGKAPVNGEASDKRPRRVQREKPASGQTGGDLSPMELGALLGRITDYLKVSGPKKSHVLAAELGSTIHDVDRVVRHEYADLFQYTPAGWKVVD